jgi:acetyl-CoA acetyltransferase
MTLSRAAVTAENLAEKYGITREECDRQSLSPSLRFCFASTRLTFSLVPLSPKATPSSPKPVTLPLYRSLTTSPT